MEDERNQTQADELKQKGNTAYRNKSYQQAIDFYTRALELKKDATYYANRAACFFYLKKYRRCVNDAEQALLLDGNYKKAYLRKGSAELALGQVEQALKTFLTGAKLDPNDQGIQKELANAKKAQSYYADYERYMKEEEYEIALRKADAVLGYCPGHESMVVNKLLLAAKMGKFDEGIKLIQEHQHEYSSNPEFIYAVGLIYCYKGSTDYAIQKWRDGNSIAPDNPKCKNAVKRYKNQEKKKAEATAVFKAKKYDEAYKLYKEAVEIDPDNRKFDSVLYSNMGTCLMKLGRKREALTDFHQALQLDPENGKAYMKRGNCRKELEE